MSAVHLPSRAPRSGVAAASTLLCLFLATGAAAQTALKVEPQAAERTVRATVTNPSGSACGAKLGFGDGREERFRIEGRETRVFDHVYAADGTYAARLEGELFVRGLRTVGPCSLDETVQVKVAPPPPPPPPPPAAGPAGQGVLGLPLNLPGLQNLPGLSGLPIALPGLTAPAPAAAPTPAPAPVTAAPPPTASRACAGTGHCTGAGAGARARARARRGADVPTGHRARGRPAGPRSAADGHPAGARARRR